MKAVVLFCKSDFVVGWIERAVDGCLTRHVLSIAKDLVPPDSQRVLDDIKCRRNVVCADSCVLEEAASGDIICLVRRQ